MMEAEQIITKAIQISGSQSAVARQLGISQPRLWYWLNKGQLVPAEYVLSFEKITGISRQEIRPDIYPKDNL